MIHRGFGHILNISSIAGECGIAKYFIHKQSMQYALKRATLRYIGTPRQFSDLIV